MPTKNWDGQNAGPPFGLGGLCMRVCVFVSMCAFFTRVCVCWGAFGSMCLCLCLCLCLCVSVSVSVSVSVPLCVWVSVCLCVSVPVSDCVCVCVYAMYLRFHLWYFSFISISHQSTAGSPGISSTRSRTNLIFSLSFDCWLFQLWQIWMQVFGSKVRDDPNITMKQILSFANVQKRVTIPTFSRFNFPTNSWIGVSWKEVEEILLSKHLQYHTHERWQTYNIFCIIE